MALFEADAPSREDAISQPLPALLEAGWLLIALLIPLAVNLRAQQPFEPSRATLLRTIVWATAGLSLAGGLLERRQPAARGDGSTPRPSGDRRLQKGVLHDPA